MLLSLLACLAPPPQTLHVAPGEGGEWDDPAAMKGAMSFTTIQAAIDAASPGDTVEIASGTYTEKVRTGDQVALVGAGMGETLLVGTILVDIGLTSSVSRLTVYDDGWYSGSSPYADHCVTVDETGSATLEELEIVGCDRGVSLLDAAGVAMDGLVVNNNTWGLYTEGGTAFSLTNSVFTTNGEAAVSLQESTTGEILHNVFVANGYNPLEGGASPSAIDLSEGHITVTLANNILVSNQHGLVDTGGTSTVFSHNLVWGNGTDYAGSASAASTDLDQDPGFGDAGEGDYSLADDSACIDAGTSTYTVAHDRDGDARPQGAEVDIGADEVAESEMALVISEVLANPVTESTGELVEVYNAGTGTVDLAGLVLSDGDEHDVLTAFDGGTTSVAAGDYAVIVDLDYDGVYAIDSGVTVVTTADSNLGNGLTTSDPIDLYESDGTTLVASASHPRRRLLLGVPAGLPGGGGGDLGALRLRAGVRDRGR